MKDVEDNNVYLTLDNHKSDEFILKQNLDALIKYKNEDTNTSFFTLKTTDFNVH